MHINGFYTPETVYEYKNNDSFFSFIFNFFCQATYSNTHYTLQLLSEKKGIFFGFFIHKHVTEGPDDQQPVMEINFFLSLLFILCVGSFFPSSSQWLSNVGGSLWIAQTVYRLSILSEVPPAEPQSS